MFLIFPFGPTLLLMAFKVYKTEGDKVFFSKLETYVAILLLWNGFLLFIFANEKVMLFAQNQSYYHAFDVVPLDVVPLIILAYVIYGMSMISSLGMYLTGKNHPIALITNFCAVLNIGLYF